MSSGVYKRKPIIKKGVKYNRLTAIRFVEMRGDYFQYWLFKCDCGNEKIICVSSVKRGTSKSCGCLCKGSKNRYKHGMVKSKVYKSWAGMKARCLNKSEPAYKNYGGRGIKICNKWLDFENFYEDMGETPQNKSLDRIDNNGNYCKKNCQWATKEEQANNKRNNHLITFNSKTQTIAQWAKELNTDYFKIWLRIKRGWNIKRALTYRT